MKNFHKDILQHSSTTFENGFFDNLFLTRILQIRCKILVQISVTKFLHNSLTDCFVFFWVCSVGLRDHKVFFYILKVKTTFTWSASSIRSVQNLALLWPTVCKLQHSNASVLYMQCMTYSRISFTCMTYSRISFIWPSIICSFPPETSNIGIEIIYMNLFCTSKQYSVICLNSKLYSWLLSKLTWQNKQF